MFNPQNSHQSKPPAKRRRSLSFHLTEEFPGWEKAETWVSALLQRYNCRRVLEVGGGANPTLSSHLVRQFGLLYTVNDISLHELAKGDALCDRWICNLSHGSAPIAERKGVYDLVFSRMVNEHVANGKQYHANILELLKPGGIAAHCCSTLYSFPMLVNRYAPERLGEILLRLFNPRLNPQKQGKFPAYYSWSRGPSVKMCHRFESVGYEVLAYAGYFGHPYYKRVPVLDVMERLKSRALLQWPITALCSYATLVLQKPAH